MIEINLLPQELRIRRDRKFKGLGGQKVDSRKMIFWALLSFLALLVLLQVILACFILARGIQLKALNATSLRLNPQKVQLQELKKEYPLLFGDEAMRRILGERISWAGKFNSLSRLLPKGVWFNSLSISEKNFLLNASVISFNKEEMNLINSFINALKADAVFFADFASLNLGAVQRRNIGGYDIVDFSLNGELKGR